MLSFVSTHDFYQDQLNRLLYPCLKTNGVPPNTAKHLSVAMWLLNFNAVTPALKSLFAKDGRPARDPIPMLRSLILMHLTKNKSITKWVELLACNSLYRVLSGFDVNDYPSVSSFYDFIDRLWLDKSDYFNVDCLRVFNSKPRKGAIGTDGKLISTRKPGIVGRLVKKVLERRKFSCDPARFLKAAFSELAVNQSLKRGVINSVVDELGNVSLSSPIGGDGTAVGTAANHHGMKVCDCRANGVYNCKCPRRFSDYHANWGWDSYKRQWFYGRHFYFLTSPDSELPLYMTVAQASRHDSVQGVVALAEFSNLHPNLTITKACWDSAHDSQSFYSLHEKLGIEPFIDLKREPAASTNLDSHGRPICPEGVSMVSCGSCPGRHRHKWRCPIMAGPKINREIAAAVCGNACSKSAYGKTFYTYNKNNLRLFPKTIRGSKQWKSVYNTRISCEHLNKKILTDYDIERCKVRSNKHWFMRGFLTAICTHLDAWFKKTDWSDQLIHNILATLD